MALVYCIYCGQEREKGHSSECPIIAGIPKAVWGIYPTGGDLEYDLSLGRLRILTAIGGGKVGPTDERIANRLSYEELAFGIRRTKWQLRKCEEERKRLSNLWFAKRKMKKLDQEICKLQQQCVNLRKFAEAWGIAGEIYDHLIESEEVTMGTPVFRNEETDNFVPTL